MGARGAPQRVRRMSAEVWKQMNVEEMEARWAHRAGRHGACKGSKAIYHQPANELSSHLSSKVRKLEQLRDSALLTVML